LIAGEDASTVHRMMWHVLNRDGWKTVNELVAETGKSRKAIITASMDLMYQNKLILASLPWRRGQILLHTVTGETQMIADGGYLVDITDIPWTLKQPLMEKIGQLRVNRFVEKIPAWVEAVMVSEKRLEKIGLGRVRPRPDDGFPYPCTWRTMYEPPWGRPARDHVFKINFMGAIRTKFAKPPPRNLPDHYDPFKYRADDLNSVVSVNADETVLTVEDVARVRVSKRSRKLTVCPRREEIVTATKERICRGVAQRDWMIPFFPIRHEFELLSNSSAGGRPGA